MNDLDQAVSAEVRAAMARKRYTVSDLAKVLEINYKPTRERYSGALPYTLSELEVVCAWCGLQVSDLLEAAEASLKHEIAA